MYLAAVAGVSAPDMYFDVTNFALYLCTTSGTNATAVWKQISGSGAGATISFSIYASGSNYSPGNIVRVTTTSVVNGVALTPGTYMCVQPVIVLAADPPTLAAIHARALEREAPHALYIEEMFSTGHDDANRAVFAQHAPSDAKVVGLALRAGKKAVDKITKGARMHP